MRWVASRESPPSRGCPGLLRSGDARRFAVALSGAIIQITRDGLRRPGEPPLTDEVEFVLDLFLRGAGRK